jgi:D-3-phosphoglycerate dehydrogenase / 2-oxoglutarate reductase
MSKPVVLVTQTTVAKEAQQLLRDAGFEIVFMQAPIDEKALLAEFSRNKVVAVLLRGPAPFTPAVLAGAKDLRIISKHGAGIDSVNLESATARGVAVMITEGVNGDAVAEHALSLMLSLARELPRFDREVRKGAWKDLTYKVKDFRERSVGIVGYGQIGSRTARLASACGARVIIHSRTRAELPAGMEWEDSLDALVARVDILSLHCSLTEKTRGLIGEKQLRLMKPGALIINTSRGKLIDEPALIAALKSGHLGGAGLDTYATEPPGPSNPLLSLPNVILTPHIASSTTHAALQMGTIAARNIISYLRGEIYDPKNFINASVFRGGG